jgi:hypothetical protein
MVERKWTIQQCSEKFEKLCVKAFVPRKGVNIPVIGRIVAAHKQSKYETKPLEEVNSQQKRADAAATVEFTKADQDRHCKRHSLSMSTFLEANALEQQKLASKSPSRQPLRHWVKSCLRITAGHVTNNVSPPTQQWQPYADDDSILCFSAT